MGASKKVYTEVIRVIASEGDSDALWIGHDPDGLEMVEIGWGGLGNRSTQGITFPHELAAAVANAIRAAGDEIAAWKAAQEADDGC